MENDLSAQAMVGSQDSGRSASKDNILFGGKQRLSANKINQIDEKNEELEESKVQYELGVKIEPAHKTRSPLMGKISENDDASSIKLKDAFVDPSNEIHINSSISK